MSYVHILNTFLYLNKQQNNHSITCVLGSFHYGKPFRFVCISSTCFQPPKMSVSTFLLKFLLMTSSLLIANSMHSITVVHLPPPHSNASPAFSSHFLPALLGLLMPSLIPSLWYRLMFADYHLWFSNLSQSIFFTCPVLLKSMISYLFSSNNHIEIS